MSNTPNEVFFYGVWPGTGAGHYLFDPRRKMLGCHPDTTPLLGALYWARSAGPYPWDTQAEWRRLAGERRSQEQGRFVLFQSETVTLITCWDRSEDRRGGCCTAFLLPGPPLDRETALQRARDAFPAVFARMERAGIEIGWTEEGP